MTARVPRPKAATRLDQLARTREGIVQAARDIVAEEGWQGAQVAFIAVRAGVATGSVYRYFESKEALFTQVLESVSRREVDVLREIIDSDGPAARRMEDAIRAFVKRALKARRLAYAILAEPCEPEIDAARLQYRGVIAHQFARVIAAGVASGEFTPVDENLAAACVAGAFMEGLVEPLAPDRKADAKSADRIATAIAQLCTRMVVKAPRKASR